MGYHGNMNDANEVEKIMRFIQELMDERNDLKRWKEEMLQIESEWDCQRVGKLLNIGLGEPIHKNIEPKIGEILQRNVFLENALKECINNMILTVKTESILNPDTQHVEMERLIKNYEKEI